MAIAPWDDTELDEPLLALDGEPIPTFQQMLEWRDLLQSDWGASAADGTSLDDQVQAEEDLYFQRFAITAPDQQYAVRTGSAPADADAAIDALTPAGILV